MREGRNAGGSRRWEWVVGPITWDLLERSTAGDGRNGRPQIQLRAVFGRPEGGRSQDERVHRDLILLHERIRSIWPSLRMQAHFVPRLASPVTVRACCFAHLPHLLPQLACPLRSLTSGARRRSQGGP